MTKESSAEIQKRQQDAAIHHRGRPARLLAGPGTGKTWSLTQRIIWLIREEGVLPTEILVLTFTRAATQELRSRIRDALGPEEVLPRISTIHSYALSQLLRNQDKFPHLPKPLRIVDDWEERYIVQEDLKDALKAQGDPEMDVRKVRRLLQDLSSDWETLKADQTDWEKNYPNPVFLATWNMHRTVFGYTMRSELVYQLKRALLQVGDFKLEGQPSHILVDEFQDLNACDLAIVQWLAEQGAEPYAAGDDDQSIYGFRNAYPLGIRNFLSDYGSSADLRLEVCQRCDREVLKLADFIIQLDLNRVGKAVQPQDDAEDGDVRLSRFPNQQEEARAIRRRCAELLKEGVAPNEMLILLRQDRNGAFSSLIAAELRNIEDGPPIHTAVGEGTALDTLGGRQLLALLKVAAEAYDSVGWRTLMELDRNNLGDKARDVIQEEALKRELVFARVLLDKPENDMFDGLDDRIAKYVEEVRADVASIRDHLDTSAESPEDKHEAFSEKLGSLPKPKRIVKDAEFNDAIAELVASLAPSAADLESAIRERGTAVDDEEVVSPGAINILTMHKAKGLGADTVFIAGAEDEYIPGRADTAAGVDDERRLLYVSLTRARHRLYLTYCDNRFGDQLYSGRTSGTSGRTLTRFLKDGPLYPTKLA